MSNINIREGERHYAFSANRMITSLQGGGKCSWIPESSLEVDSISGKDEDGNQCVVSKNGDGSLKKDLMPEKIVMDTTPLRISYANGEAIDYTGLRVIAYTHDGNVWTNGGLYVDGVIPNSEILPNTAIFTPYWIDGTFYCSSGAITIRAEGASPFLRAIFYTYVTQGIGTTIYWPDCMLVSSCQENVQITVSGIDVQTISGCTYDESTGLYWINIDFDGQADTNIWGWPLTDDAVRDIVPLYGQGGDNWNVQYVPVEYRRPDGVVLSAGDYVILVDP